MRSPLLTLIALIGIAAPVTGIAQTYLTPEQVLEQQKLDANFLVPSHQRGARWASDLEAELSRQRHPSIIQQPGDPVQDDGLPPPVDVSGSENVAPVVPVSANPYQNLDPLTVRLLARLEQQNLFLQSTLQSTAGQNGAPLADTGPAAVLSILAMGGATLWTLRRAKVLERFVGEL